jgi:hypothetical protein
MEIDGRVSQLVVTSRISSIQFGGFFPSEIVPPLVGKGAGIWAEHNFYAMKPTGRESNK